MGNLTRLVVVVWLFVVLILNSSYTASLTSMLTIQRLKPNVTGIKWLKRNNLPVGCDGDSFVRNHRENVLQFKPENIKNVSSEYNSGMNMRSRALMVALQTKYCFKFISSCPYGVLINCGMTSSLPQLVLKYIFGIIIGWALSYLSILYINVAKAEEKQKY